MLNRFHFKSPIKIKQLGTVDCGNGGGPARPIGCVSNAGIIRLPDRLLRGIWQADLLNFVKSLLIIVLHVSTRGLSAQARQSGRLGQEPSVFDLSQRLRGFSRIDWAIGE